jgi:hypothetical protein
VTPFQEGEEGEEAYLFWQDFGLDKGVHYKVGYFGETQNPPRRQYQSARALVLSSRQYLSSVETLIEASHPHPIFNSRTWIPENRSTAKIALRYFRNPGFGVDANLYECYRIVGNFAILAPLGVSLF